MENDGRLITKEDLLEELKYYTADDILKATWVMAAVPFVPVVLKTVEETYRRSNGSTIKYGFIGGSFARKKIGHWEDYEQLEKKYPSMSFNEFKHRKMEAINRIIKHHQDVDLVTIIKRYGDTADVFNKLNTTLPQPNSCLEDVDFYGFDTQTILTETQVNRKLRYLQNGEINLLHPHELEILSPKPIREVVPILIFRNDQNVDPTIREMVDEGLDKKRFRDIETWYEETWLPAVRPFAKRFPKLYDTITGCILDRVERGDFRIRDEKVIEEVKQKITNM